MAQYSFLPLKIKPVHLLQDRDSRFVKVLGFNSFLRWWLMSIGYGTFCRVEKSIFASMDKLTPSTIVFGTSKTLTIPRNNPCIPKKGQHGDLKTCKSIKISISKI